MRSATNLSIVDTLSTLERERNIGKTAKRSNRQVGDVEAAKRSNLPTELHSKDTRHRTAPPGSYLV